MKRTIALAMALFAVFVGRADDIPGAVGCASEVWTLDLRPMPRVVYADDVEKLSFPISLGRDRKTLL